jgi:glutathione S-transferase
MKVFGHPLSSCTRKVLITLTEKGQKADLVPIDLFTGEQRSEGHRARHPFGMVPVLDDEGFVLFESRAIIRYLDARFEGTSLTPSTPRDAARMNQWLSVDQSYVAPHARTLALERIVKKHEGVAPNEDAERTAEEGLRASFSILDRALRQATFLAGDTFSLADVSLMPYVASLSMLAAEHVTAGLPHLGAWWARVRERPSWRHAAA